MALAKYQQGVNTLNVKELKAYISAMGKQANQRLAQLSTTGFGGSSQAYQHISNLTASESGYVTDKLRKRKGTNEYYTTPQFNLNTRNMTRGLDNRQQLLVLRHQARNIEKFLQQKTSTTKGVRQMYAKTERTFKERGIDVNAQELGELFKAYKESGLASDVFGSDQVVDVYKKYYDNLTIDEVKEIMNTVNGTKFSDYDKGFKEQILYKRFYGEIPPNVIDEYVRDNPTLTLNELIENLSEYISDDDFIDSEEW